MKISKNQYYSGGSTLLLAMVIVSTVLLVGVSMSLILSRQTREGVVIRGESIGFYVADSVIEKIGLDPDEFNNEEDWHNFELIRDSIEYNVKHKSGKEYFITVRVGSNYYEFIREIREEVEINDGMIIYFENPMGWSDVVIHYYLRDGSGSTIADYKRNMVVSSSENYPNYMEHEIDFMGNEEETEEIRLFFCDEIAEEMTTSCWGSSSGKTYRYDIKNIKEQGTKVCQDEKSVHGTVCTSPFISSVNNEKLEIYFKKPAGWSDVVIHYYLRDGSGSAIADYKRNMVVSSSENYPNYMEHEIDFMGNEEETEEIRLFFCDEIAEEMTTSCWGSSSGKTYRYDIKNIKEQGTKVCQDEKSVHGTVCTSPFISSVNIPN